MVRNSTYALRTNILGSSSVCIFLAFVPLFLLCERSFLCLANEAPHESQRRLRKLNIEGVCSVKNKQATNSRHVRNSTRHVNWNICIMVAGTVVLLIISSLNTFFFETHTIPVSTVQDVTSVVIFLGGNSVIFLSVPRRIFAGPTENMCPSPNA